MELDTSMDSKAGKIQKLYRAPHLQIIADDFEGRRQKNARYSLRAYANFLRVHPSALSRILSGKQPLSLKCAIGILRKISMSEEEAQIFIQSIADEKRTNVIEILLRQVRADKSSGA